jgi:hypothetical protein
MNPKKQVAPLTNLMEFCNPSRIECDDSVDESPRKTRSMMAEDSLTATSESPERLSLSSRDSSFVTPEPRHGLEQPTDAEIETTYFDPPVKGQRSSYLTVDRFISSFPLLLLGLIIWKSSIDCNQVASDLRAFPAPTMFAFQNYSDYAKAAPGLHQSLNITDIPDIPDCDTLVFHKMQSDASGAFLTSCTASVQRSQREEESSFLSCM